MVFYIIRDLIYKWKLGKIMDKWNNGEELTNKDMKNFYFAKALRVRENTLKNYISLWRDEISKGSGLLKRAEDKMDEALIMVRHLPNFIRYKGNSTTA